MTMFFEKIDTALIDVESLPWVPFLPYTNNAFVKAIKVDPIRGEWITLLKAPADIELPRHHHSGTVHVYTISGEWKYKEHDWVAKPGTSYSKLPVRSTRPSASEKRKSSPLTSCKEIGT